MAAPKTPAKTSAKTSAKIAASETAPAMAAEAPAARKPRASRPKAAAADTAPPAPAKVMAREAAGAAKSVSTPASRPARKAAPQATARKDTGRKDTAPKSAAIGHAKLANAVRFLAADAVEKAKSGHPGLPLGMADVATVLFTKFLTFDPAAPDWADRDRFVLSAGHGSMLLYALLHLSGYPDVTLDELKRFRQLHSRTPGHPENFETKGVETTTGPLGQGIATAVGMALAERMLHSEYGHDIVDHHTYVIASDGDLMEGISHEAIALAGHLKLSRLIVLFDDNGISIDGPLTLSDSVDQVMRFKACGWNASSIDGHDPDAIARAIRKAQGSDRPTLIACKTKIGYGAPNKAGTSKAHGEPLGEAELAATRVALGWSHPAFEVPDDIRAEWLKAGKKGAAAHKAWSKRLAANPAAKEFARRMAGERPMAITDAIATLKSKLLAEPQTVATRKASELALEALVPAMPELVLGSADLTPSNNTRTKGLKEIGVGDFAGRYIHYGIREHGMAAAMNGLALHGGFVPAGGTFFVFSDYCRPAIRLSALMGAPVVYVMTHDSIGLGEDGPTHQPVEHLAAMRAMPNLKVYRPCDAVETAECWQLALERTDGPSLLALTRQNLVPARKHGADDNLSARGAYEISPAANGKAKATLFASGSEVEIALSAQELLAARGISARVVSVPSLETFLAQSEKSKKAVIGDAPVKVAIEAGVRFGWDAVIGRKGIFVGMTGFGASGPYKELYAHFGITAQAVADQVFARHNQ